jgi:hypothetical protein
VRYCGFSPTENLALKKPADQSTDVSGSKAHWAKYAVDGDINGIMRDRAAECAMTQRENSPWWFVDLQVEANVRGVKIVNRADCCGDELRNFQIGLSYVNPFDETPTLDNYEVCVDISGAFATGESRIMPCDGIGVFLIIQMRERGVLTLCEVEVYGKGVWWFNNWYMPPI